MRGGWAPQVALPIAPGEKLTNSKLTQATVVVSDALKKERDAELQVKGAFSVTYVDACVKADDTAKTVDVVIRPFAVRIGLENISANILPVPRSPKATFFSQLPGPLVALNPTFGLDQDRKAGTSEVVGFSTNLLDMPRLVRGDPPSSGGIRLLLDARGQKSFDNPFYNAGGRLKFSSQHPLERIRNLALEAGFDASHDPLGAGISLRNTTLVGASARVRLGARSLKDLTLGAGYRHVTERFTDNAAGITEMTPEHAFTGRVILDGRIAGGFTRFGAWGEVASPDHLTGSYQRFAALVGYEKEFAVATNQTVGIDATFGFGRAVGDVPQYAQFYGGNWSGNYLYEAQDSVSLNAIPTGPLIRSFGRNQASLSSGFGTFTGGNAFWHFNLNTSIPIPRWSYPLIPNEDIDGISLKQVLKAQLNSSKNFIITQFKKSGMTLERATTEADKSIQEVRPAVEFIADQANVYSVKPLVMLDAARLWIPGMTNDRTWIAVGGGVQLTIVVAKFEAGYLRTLNRETGDNAGNFVLRLVFQNLF